MWFAFCRAPLLATMCLCLVACAGYRGGWEMVAYIGETPPPVPAETRTMFESFSRETLNVPGLQLVVRINNQLLTYDNYPTRTLPAFPVDVEPGRTRVRIFVIPTESGFVFRPTLAVLNVAGKQFGGIAGFEFDMRDLQGNRVMRGGKFDYRPIADELTLEAGRNYVLSVDFATPVPSPQSSDLSVDLSRALQADRQPLLPLIRFAPVRFREGYQ